MMLGDVTRRVLSRLTGRKNGRSKAKPARVSRRIVYDGPHPKGATFHDIVIVPGTRDGRSLNALDGGPIWPNFKRQTWVRHRRRTNRFVDRRPKRPSDPPIPVTEPCIWGGQLFLHFGHLAAENTTRLLWSVKRWPNAPVLFIADPGTTVDTLPGYFWSIVEWLGLRRGQVRIVTVPLRVKTLMVMPQAESLGGAAPPPDYLDLLAENQKARDLQSVASRFLYVGRTGQIQAGNGAHAGESYLVSLLERCGVSIMDPTTAPFREQLARYAGADVIIFAEGSALHGRQFLGRLDQQIHVLNRRPKARPAQVSLTPRVTSVTYHEVTAGLTYMSRNVGRPYRSKGISFYDVRSLLDALTGMGLDVSSQWNAPAYDRAKTTDAEDWLKRIDRLTDPERRTADRAFVRAVFEAEGLGRLLEDDDHPSTLQNADPALPARNSPKKTKALDD